MINESNVVKGAAHEAVVSLNDNGSVKRATKQAAPKELWGRKLTRGERQCWAQGFNAAPVTAAPGIDLAPVRVALTDVYVALCCINAGDDGSVDIAADALVRLREAIALIDASHKGG